MSNLALVRKQITDTIDPIRRQITTITIKDSNDYTRADTYLTMVADAMKEVDAQVDKVLKPLNEARKAALDLKNEAKGPLLLLDTTLREAMRNFKLIELQEIRQAEKMRQDAARAAQIQADILRQKELAAKTAPMRAKLVEQREALESKVEEIEAEPIPAFAKPMGSSAPTVDKVRVLDIKAFIKACAADQIGDWDAFIPVMEIEASLEKYMKMTPATRFKVSKMPGIEIYEDVKIRRKGGK